MSEKPKNAAENRGNQYYRQFAASFKGEALHGEGLEAFTEDQKIELDGLLSQAGFVGVDDPALEHMTGSFGRDVRDFLSSELSLEEKRSLKGELLADLVEMRERAGDGEDGYKIAA